MYKFKTNLRDKVLQGRSVNYVAINILKISPVYLSNILNGSKGCSVRLAKDIVELIDTKANINDYFTIKEK